MHSQSRQIAMSLLIFLVCFAALDARAVEVGDSAPDWTLADASGGKLDYFQDARGKVSVLLFWATWCPFCRSLMPHLQEAANFYRDAPVRFYALNVWEENDPVRYMKDRGYTFRLLLSAEAVAAKYGVKGTPGLFVIGKDHRVLYKRSPGTDDFEVELLVNEAIHGALAAD